MRTAALLLLCCLSTATARAQQSALEAARTYRTTHGPAIVSGFADLLSLPNVGTDSVNIGRNAAYIRDAFTQRGVDVELLTLPGAPPLVFGKMEVPGATRTIGIYAHYDGQPVDETRWTHGPYQPTLYTAAMEEGGEPRRLPDAGEAVDPEWRLYARSAGDDKAPIPALLAALDALNDAGITPTSNLLFLFEGEEELGSPHLPAYVDTYGDRFGVDVWLFCDGPMHQSGRPQILFGVRGVTGLGITVYGAVRSLHSGHYGNWAPVPGMMLSRLLASMKDEDGDVLIDGFYDTDAPIGDAERAALKALPAYDETLKHDLGLARTEGDGAPLNERLLLPSLTVKGLSSGNVGARARNVIPDRAEAALGIRLVKGNDPDHMLDLVERHVEKQGYHIVRDEPDLETRLRYPRLAKVTRGGGYPASRTSMDLPIVQSVVRAVTAAAGEPPIQVPSAGGSLPLYLFSGVLKAPTIIVPIANYDDNQHAPDENLRVGNLWYGIDLYAALLTM